MGGMVRRLRILIIFILFSFRVYDFAIGIHRFLIECEFSRW